MAKKIKKVKIDYTNKNKKNKKEYLKLLYLGIFFFVILFGVSYAFLSSINVSKEKTEIVSGTLKIEYLDSNNINLGNASPLSDTEGMKLDPYTFTIKNTGTLDGKYNVSIEEKEGNTLDKRYIKYSIKEGDGEWSTPIYLNTGLILTSNKVLSSQKEITYQLKMWLDEGAPNEVQGQKYAAKIVVNTVQTNADLKDIENPIIVLNGNTTVNIEQNQEFIDPGISKITDKDNLKIENITKKYEYFDGTNTIPVEGIDTTKIGTYYIYYSITDKEGNTGTSIRVVNVHKKDTTLPTIALIGDEVITLKYGQNYIEYGASAIDLEDGNVTDKIKITGVVNENAPGIYIIKYTILDSAGNIASITREVIVLPKEGTLEINLKQDNTDITKTQIDISAITDADEVKYAITTTKDKPLDSEFKTLEELKEDGTVSEDGKIEITKNGTYYIWVKDKNGNIKYQEVIVTTIDETTPSCIFNTVDYIGLNQEKEITLTCTDIADISEKTLTVDDFNTTNENGEIISISSPERVENGYRYTIIVKAKNGGEFGIILPKNKINDKAGNKNLETTSNVMKVTKLAVGSEEVNLDISRDNEKQITTGGSNLGQITYQSEDETIATVTSEGLIKGVNPGTTNIIVKESNSGLTKKIKVNIEKTLKASFEKNGYGVIGISKYSATCKLTSSNPTTCSVEAPTINVEEGYTAIGWNADKTSHNGSYDISLSEDTIFYTIAKKNAITLTAKFNANGATLSNTSDKTCVLEEVYNEEIQASSCVVTTPIITGSSNTPIVVGYSEELAETTDENLLPSGGDLTLTTVNDKHTWYAITKSNPITYEITYDKNSEGVDKIGSTKDSCTIATTYNGVAQETSCEITLPTITAKEGYTAIGWNEDKNSHTGEMVGEKYSLSKNTILYAIVKKNSIVYTATFIKNGLGVTDISKTTDSCTIDEVYNNEEQATTCHIDLPTITVEGLWKVLGWSEDKATHDDYTKIEDGITLTKKATTLYSISKKDELTLSAEFNSNGANLSTSEGVSCTLEEVYNNEERDDFCVLTTPLVTRDNFDFVGYSKDASSHKNDSAYDKEANQIKLDANNTDNTWYAITKRDLTVKYNRNGATTIEKETDSCTIWNSATTCDITLPNITRDTFDILGWNESKDADDNSIDTIPITTTIEIDTQKEYFAITKKDIEIKFYKNNAIGQTNSDGEIVYDEYVTRECRITNREETCSIKSPSIAAPYNTPIVVGYGISSDATTSSWNVITTKNVTDSTNYYAVTKNNDITYQANFLKQGLGVSSISSTTASCTIAATYNGTAQPKSCTINMPTITVEEGYTALGWSTYKNDTTDYITATTIDLTSNVTLYAISKKDEIILTGNFYKNGAESQTLFQNGTIVTSSDEIVKVSCKLEEAFNNNVQSTECKISVPIINASSVTPTVIGYATNKDATIKNIDPNIELTIDNDVDYYAITKKDAVTFTANFDENNATLSSTDSKQCIVSTTYNGQEQDKSCTVDAPSITAPENTPIVVGFNLTKDDTKNNNNYDKTTEKLTLNSDNTDSVWYAITKKDTVTYTVNYKIGDHVSSISKDSGKCTIPETYNGTKQTTVCVIREDDTENNPVITPNVGYTSIGWSQLASSTVGSPAVVLSKDNMTFYAHAQANTYNINYVSDDTVFSTMSVTYDEPFVLKTIKQLNLTKRGYTFNSWTSNDVTYQDGASISTNLATEEGTNVPFVANWDDLEKPVCRFIQVGNTTTQNQTIVKMECTDTGSGVVRKTLTPDDFTLSNTTNGIIDSVSEPTEITDGYSYDLTVRGLSVGTFDITIPAETITDNAGNGISEATTPTSVLVNGRIYTIKYTKGDNIDAIATTSDSCITEGSSITCNVILPSYTPSIGYTTKGWLNTRGVTTGVGSSYTLTENTTGETLTATSHDITPPECSISGNPTDWTQSATLSVSATDLGSGLDNNPYSWTSKTDEFTTTTTKTITANGTYKAYAKDKDGNVGECSVTATKIDTTKPSCTFSNISDTTIVSGNTATIDLTCTDTQSLINTTTNTLSTDDFTLSSSVATITNVTAPTTVTNGYKYTITIQGASYGAFNISLNANSLKDNASNYNDKVTSSNMTSYNKATIGSCNSLTYNGSDQNLVSGGTGITYTNNIQTNAGNYTVIATPNSDYMYSDEATNKTLSCSIGQKAVTYKANSSTKTYDGTALTNTTASITSGSLVSGHTATPSITGTITDVGSTTNTLNSVTIKSGSTDVTANYKITKVNGTLTINKRSTTCTAASSSKVYDKIALTNANGGSCTNLVSGQTATFTNTGTITNVGSVTNTLTSVVIKSGTTDVSGNYTITKANGTLTVTQATPTVSLSSKTATYTGSAISANTATNTGDGALSYAYYTNSTCTTQTTTSTGASAAGAAPVDAGTYYVKATAKETQNYKSAASSCVSLVINKKSVAVAWGSTTTFTMNGSAQAPTASASSGVTGETLNITRTTATAVGSYTSTATLSSVTGGRAKTANYTLTNTTKSYKINGITRSATIYSNGNTLSTPSGCTASGTNRVCSCTTTGTSTTCSVTSPTITAPSNTPVVCGYTTSSTGTTSCSIVSGESVKLSSSPSYYAQTYKSSVTYTATFAAGTGVSEISSTRKSCTIAATYNGTAQSTSCLITFPSVILMEDYTMKDCLEHAPCTGIAGWYNASENMYYVGNYFDCTSSGKSFVAKARKMEIYYDFKKPEPHYSPRDYNTVRQRYHTNTVIKLNEIGQLSVCVYSESKGDLACFRNNSFDSESERAKLVRVFGELQCNSGYSYCNTPMGKANYCRTYHDGRLDCTTHSSYDARTYVNSCMLRSEDTVECKQNISKS